MSDVYIYRLRKVRDEFDAARGAITFLNENWNQRGFGERIEGISQTKLEMAASNLESTYFIRLYAEFEGILKDHLVSNHPARAFTESERPKIDAVISRIALAERLKINPKLRRRLDASRDYRNSIAHARRTPVVRVTIADGVASLGRFVDMLPDPLD